MSPSNSDHQMQRDVEIALIEPFAKHSWKARSSRSHWSELEGWQDAIAGPVSAVASTGGCSYVYARNDACFDGVRDPDTLLERLLDWHASVDAGIDRFVASTEAENTDLAYMKSLSRRLHQLICQTHECELRRIAGRPGSAPDA